MSPRWATGRSSGPVAPGYFRRKLAELLADMAGGVVQAIPQPLQYQEPAPVVPIRSVGDQPAVGFGGGGTTQEAAAPESTATFAPGTSFVATFSPAAQIIGAGTHSRALIANQGPGPCWLGPAADVDTTRSERLDPGESLLMASSAGVFAIAAPGQPAQLTWRIES